MIYPVATDSIQRTRISLAKTEGLLPCACVEPAWRLAVVTDGKQQFVGYLNMQKFTARIVPTFREKVKRVVLTGASAGGFGTTLNFYEAAQGGVTIAKWVTDFVEGKMAQVGP